MMTISEQFSTHTRLRSRKTLVSRVFLFLSIWRERTALSELDTHLLADIGLTGHEAKSEATRPVWDAPERWMR